MIEAAMIWNEPNNKSHWNPDLDPDWSIYADTVIRAARSIAAVNPQLTRVLGGMSPIDAHWVQRMRAHDALDEVEVVAVHGFPLDWNLWPIDAWPDKIAEIEAVAPDKPIWATEVGVGSFGAEEVQVFGLNRTAELLTLEIEDYAVARLTLAGGTVVRLACSWNLHAGQQAVIQAEFYGDTGGTGLRNVDGSFYEFEAFRYRGTDRVQLSEGPDEWGGGAAIDWAHRLAAAPSFDPAADRLVEVAHVIDRIYAGGSAATTSTVQSGSVTPRSP